MTNPNIVPLILNVQPVVELDISEDLNSAQTKSIAECLYENNNQQDLENSEKTENQKNNEKKEQQ